MSFRLRVHILTEGGLGIGYGHMTRCLALMQAFIHLGHEVHLIVHAHGNVDYILAGYSFDCHQWMMDKSLLINIAGKADIIVVDSYLADRFCYDELVAKEAVGVFIDDYQRIPYPEGHIVVNVAAAARQEDYQGHDPKNVLLGPRYAAIRQDFWHVPDAKVADTIGHVLIMCGGIDINSLTTRLLEKVQQYDSSWACTAIVTKNSMHPALVGSSAGSRVNVVCEPDVRQLRDMMRAHDMAISAGGQTLYELARIGLPTAALVTVDNQRPNVEGFEQAGFAFNVPGQVDNAFTPGLFECFDKLRSKETRRQSALNGQCLVDGQGALRIAHWAIQQVEASW